jgi:hypothetical protein
MSRQARHRMNGQGWWPFRTEAHYFTVPDRYVSLAKERARPQQGGMAMISLLIGILIICVVGAICFWAIDKFVRDGRLAGIGGL